MIKRERNKIIKQLDKLLSKNLDWKDQQTLMYIKESIEIDGEINKRKGGKWN